MATSEFVKNIDTLFDTLFPEGWIDSYNWNNQKNHKQFLNEGLNRIFNYKDPLFCNLAKIVLSGDFFVNNPMEQLDALSAKTWEDYIPTKWKNRNLLKTEFDVLMKDVRDSIMLVKYHVDSVLRKYKGNDDRIFSVLEYHGERSSRGELVKLLDLLCDTCWLEYIFSYDEDYLRQLILMRERLIKIEKLSEEAKNIRDAAIVKIELMLYKLRHYYADSKLSYSFNFKNVDLVPLQQEEGKIAEFRECFNEYIEEKHINSKRLAELQNGTLDQNVPLWKYVLLMHYYIKVPRVKAQVQNLFELSEKHFSDNIKLEENLVDAYSVKSARNYMYNSRFAFLCTYDKEYTLSQMKDDIRQIQIVQEETGIRNYHPFQTAFEYTYKQLNIAIEKGEPQSYIDDLIKLLNDFYDKFKNNVQWCKHSQQYLVQLRYNYCTVEDQKRNLKIFCPSSFVRPLKFEVLDEKVVEFRTQISLARNRAVVYKDRREMMAIEEKINNIENKSFERMSFFSTIIIFLVGLITIFTGNGASVSITDKMQYVAVLGVILLLFLCLNYFLTSKRFENWRPYIFGSLIVLFMIFLASYFFNSDNNKSIPTRDSETQLCQPAFQTVKPLSPN